MDVRNNLKVPLRFSSSARRCGIYKESMFYYRIKTIRIDGSFGKAEAVKEFSLATGYSVRHIHRYINKLINIGFIREIDGRYCLVSYNTFFSILGYKLSKIKLRYIKADRFQELESAIQYEDIADNLNKQKYAVEKRKKASMPMKTGKDHIDEPNLSCAKVASILGLKSASSGYKVERMLEVKEFIKVKRRISIVDIDCHRFVRSKGLIREGNILYKVHSNIIYSLSS